MKYTLSDSNMSMCQHDNIHSSVFFLFYSFVVLYLILVSCSTQLCFAFFLQCDDFCLLISVFRPRFHGWFRHTILLYGEMLLVSSILCSPCHLFRSCIRQLRKITFGHIFTIFCSLLCEPQEMFSSSFLRIVSPASGHFFMQVL